MVVKIDDSGGGKLANGSLDAAGSGDPGSDQVDHRHENEKRFNYFHFLLILLRSFACELFLELLPSLTLCMNIILLL